MHLRSTFAIASLILPANTFPFRRATADGTYPANNCQSLHHFKNKTLHDHLLKEVIPELLDYPVYRDSGMEMIKRKGIRDGKDGDGIDGLVMDHYCPPPDDGKYEHGGPHPTT